MRVGILNWCQPRIPKLLGFPKNEGRIPVHTNQLYAQGSWSLPSQSEKVCLVFVLWMAEVILSKGFTSSGGMIRR